MLSFINFFLPNHVTQMHLKLYNLYDDGEDSKGTIENQKIKSKTHNTMTKVFENTNKSLQNTALNTKNVQQNSI